MVAVEMGLSQRESQIPSRLGVGGDRFVGTVSSYLDGIEAAIVEGASGWVAERRSHRHYVLPYEEGPYDLLAINTPSSYEQGAIPTNEEPPIGMIRVVASANAAGYRAGTLDAHALNLTVRQIADQIDQTQPRLVGLNPTSVNVAEGKALAALCDRMRIPYILGGIHATLSPAIARRDFPHAHAIVRGDGELAVRAILAEITGEGCDDSVMNGVYKRNDLRSNDLLAPYAPKMHVGEIPWYPQDKYVQYPIVVQTITIGGKEYTVKEGSLYSTRGCPFECGFCASPVMVGRHIKGTRPYDHPGMARVIAEVKDMQRLGANAVHFLDDMVIVQPYDVDAFYFEAEKEGILGTFAWRGMTRAPVIARKSFTDETLDKLRKTGCWRLTIGVESGDNDILRMIKKQITTEQVEVAVRKLVSAGIQVKAFFIMGFPSESLAQMNRTHDFVLHLKDLGLTSISIFQFKPYPGTALWDQVAQNNPQALTRLDYIGGDAREMNVGGNRAIQGVYLPDDLIIADGVTSGTVRELVQTTLGDFFS